LGQLRSPLLTGRLIRNVDGPNVRP
jgi:hypothetical protein